MKKLAAVCLVALLNNGCATIVKGGHTYLTVTSPTPDAEVHIRSTKHGDVYEGPAPAKVEVSKKDEYLVTVTAPGHKDRKVSVTHGFQGWTVGNIILIIPVFWAVGIAVDAMSGAINTLDPTDLEIALVKAAQPAPTPAPSQPATEPVPPPIAPAETPAPSER